MLLPQALPAGAEQVVATATATDLLSLIRTASSNAGFDFDPRVNFCVLQVDSTEDDSIRYSTSYTPTSARGIEVTGGNSVEIALPPEQIKVIRTAAADQTINLQVYRI